MVGVMPLLRRLWPQISQRRRRQYGLMFVLMSVSAFAEMISLGAVLPFLGALTAPDHLFRQPFVAGVAQMFGITSAARLVLPLTIAFIVTALVAGAIRMLLLWASTRVAFASGADLSIAVYRRTLYQPYSVHVALNSSQLISGISKKTEAVAFGVLLPMLTLLSSLILLVGIVLALLVIDARVAIGAASSFGLAYLLISHLSQRELRRNSERIAKEQTHVVQALQEGLGGIRDVLLDGTQEFYCRIYSRANGPLWRGQHVNGFISGGPKFVMEAFGVALIAVLAYSLSLQADGVGAAIPVLGALALGAQRLLPALQQSFASWTSIVGQYGALSDVLELIERPLPTGAGQPDPAPLSFEREIQFDHVGFRYEASAPWVLEDVNLSIAKGAWVGFVGRTGCGKSTVLDLLMVLLDPTEGMVMVDGEPLTGERKRAWQQTIAHVPQNIYLADVSLAENIALGVTRDAIDTERMIRSARLAQIEDFIESRPGGYDALIGERGVQLSGGQRQRIGIARALYKRSNILVLDEATSALDSHTEQAVLGGIATLGREVTVLIVAHRPTALRRCDEIIKLDGGRIVQPHSQDM